MVLKRFSPPSVCLSVCFPHGVSKTEHQTWRWNVPRWVLETQFFRVRRSKVKVTLPAWVFALLWVLASSSWFRAVSLLSVQRCIVGRSVVVRVTESVFTVRRLTCCRRDLTLRTTHSSSSSSRRRRWRRHLSSSWCPSARLRWQTSRTWRSFATRTISSRTRPTVWPTSTAWTATVWRWTGKLLCTLKCNKKLSLRRGTARRHILKSC